MNARGALAVMARGFSPILEDHEVGEAKPGVCFDCGRDASETCVRCGRALCTAHEANHETFRRTHGRCYYGVAQDHAAVRGARP